MAAHSNGQAIKAIIFYCVISIFLLSFCARLVSAVADWCGLSANLECMPEICCKRLAENTG